MSVQPPSFTVTQPLDINIEYIGLERTPIIIVDNLAADLTSLLNFAYQAPFTKRDNSYYPGVRSSLPKPYVISVIEAIYGTMFKIYQVPQHLRMAPVDIVFSLITKKPCELTPMQCMPHFDTPDPHFYAILHYLNTRNDHQTFGGTGFFRHNPTQFERISNERSKTYFDSAQQFINQHGAPLNQYQSESDEHFTLYHSVDYRPNRLVIYPGNLLHSTLVNAETDIDSSARTGRLTSNIFVKFQ